MTFAAESRSPQVAGKSWQRAPKSRSKIANGTALLPHLDGRTALAIRFRELYLGILDDLGGEDRVSEGVRQLGRIMQRVDRYAGQNVAVA